MKRFKLSNWLMALFLVMTAGLWSCNDEDVDNEGPVVTPAPATLTFEATGGQQEVTITSNREWSVAVSEPDFVSVSPVSGNGNSKITVTLLANNQAQRSAKLTITASTASATVDIIQKAGDGSGEVSTDALYKETVGSDVEKTDDKWPYVDAFTGWKKEGIADQSGVTYGGSSASVRNSGAAYEPADGSDYTGAPYVFMSSATANFIINNINVNGKTNFTFTMGVLEQTSYDDATKKPGFGAVSASTCAMFASVDGTTWSDLSFTADGVAGWSKVTSEFKLPEGSAKLYIKIENGSNQVRYDDFQLFEGGNGELIGKGEQPGELQETTIADLVKKITPEAVAVGNYKVKGIVMTDMAAGNYSIGGFSIQTEGATQPGNGILVFKYQEKFQDASGNPLFVKGDEVEIDLSEAQIQAYKGSEAQKDPASPACNELIVTGPDCIKKTGRTVSVEPVVITADKIADYQSMYVQIDDAESKDKSLTAWASGTVTFKVGAQEFNVYIGENSTIIGQDYLTGKGTIKGLAYVYGGSSKANSAAQLVPRDYNDVSGLTAGEIVNSFSVSPLTKDVPAAGGEVSVDVKANVAWTAAIVSGGDYIESVTESGEGNGKVTVKFKANEDTENTRTVSIKVSTTAEVDQKEYTVEFTQAKASNIPVGNMADFNTLTASSAYKTYTTTAGWVAENAAVQSGGNKDSNPVFMFIGSADTKAICLNGKTSSIGVLTSPVLNGGCGTLSFKYGYAFGEANGVAVKIEIKQNDIVVKTFTLEKSNADVAQKTAYDYSVDVNVSGDFKLVITNNAPSGLDSNKDRLSIWNVSWTGNTGN